MATAEHNLEILSTALSHYQAMQRACISVFSLDGARAESRALNRLEDAAVACGMDRSHGDLVGWAAERVAAWLVAA